MVNPNKIEDALAQALEFETAKKASKDHIRVRQIKEFPNGRQKSSLRNNEKQKEKISDVTELSKSLIVTPNEANRCWNCGAKEHYKRNCLELHVNDEHRTEPEEKQ